VRYFEVLRLEELVGFDRLQLVVLHREPVDQLDERHRDGHTHFRHHYAGCIHVCLLEIYLLLQIVHQWSQVNGASEAGGLGVDKQQSGHQVGDGRYIDCIVWALWTWTVRRDWVHIVDDGHCEWEDLDGFEHVDFLQILADIFGEHLQTQEDEGQVYDD